MTQKSALACFPTILFLLIFHLAIYGQTVVTSPISGNTTWTTAGSPYILQSSLFINNGVTLTIQPGVVVKIDGAFFSIIANGNISAVGTAGNPIVFTSFKDDANGGDTNGDGGASSPQPGDWVTLRINNSGTGTFQHCRFLYGGNFGNGVLEFNGGGSAQDCLFDNNEGGIGPAIAFNAQPTLQNLSFGSNELRGIALVSGASPNSGNFTLNNYPGYPFLLTTSTSIPNGVNITMEAGAVVKFTGIFDAITVFGGLTAIGTPGQPIVFTSIDDDANGGDTNNNGSGTSPQSGSWLSVKINNSGTGTFQHCRFLYGGNFGNGVLEFNGGGSAQDCLFDNNEAGIGPAMAFYTQPAMQNLTFGSNELQGIALVSGLGSTSGNFTLNNYPAYPFLITTSTSIPSNVNITMEAGTVVKFTGIFDAITVFGGLTAIGTPGQPIVFTSIDDDANGGDTNNNGSGTSPQSGSWLSVKINNNGTGTFQHCRFLYGGNFGNGVLEFNGGGSAQDCLFDNNEAGIGPAMAFTSQPTFENLTFGSNQLAGIALLTGPTNINGNYTLNNYDGFPFLITNVITIPSGVNLTVEAGSVFKFLGIFDELGVAGRITAIGTATDPIVFTSIRDDEYGGDTNQDGNGTFPAAGDWDEVNLRSFSGDNSAQFEKCLFRYGGNFTGALRCARPASIEACTFYENETGIRVVSGGNATVTNSCFIDNDNGMVLDAGTALATVSGSKFYGNSNFGIDNNAGISVTATNNWWGDASGPFNSSSNPGGLGDPVSANVTFTPFSTTSDPESPVAVCQDITVQLDADGNGSFQPVDLDGGSSDDCCITLFSAAPQTQFDCGDLGPHTIVLTVTDGVGNKSSCNAIVTVVDNLAPTAICRDVTVSIGANGADVSLTPQDINNGSFDNCSIAGYDITEGKTTYTCLDIGSGPQPVTLSVTDGSGNVSTCNATVIVADNIAPTAICQNVTVSIPANGTVNLNPQAVDNGSFDNCSIAGYNITEGKITYTCLDIGSGPQSVTLSVTDGFGNASTCNATVTVVDNIDPTAICRNITVAIATDGALRLTPQAVDNGSFDNCSITGYEIIAGETIYTCLDIDSGPQPVTLRVTDSSNNTSTCQATVTVTDDDSNCSCDTQNLSVPGNPITSGTYLAEQTVTSTGTVAADSIVVFIAGDNVRLLPGFQALAGSRFVAITDDCQPFAPALPTPPAFVEAAPRKEKQEVDLRIFPNPFSSTANLVIDLPEEKRVSLSILDVNGRLIQHVLDHALASQGSTQYVINADLLRGKGIYFVILRTKDRTVTRRLVYLAR